MKGRPWAPRLTWQQSQSKHGFSALAFMMNYSQYVSAEGNLTEIHGDAWRSSEPAIARSKRSGRPLRLMQSQLRLQVVDAPLNLESGKRSEWM